MYTHVSCYCSLTYTKRWVWVQDARHDGYWVREEAADHGLSGILCNVVSHVRRATVTGERAREFWRLVCCVTTKRRANWRPCSSWNIEALLTVYLPRLCVIHGSNNSQTSNSQSLNFSNLWLWKKCFANLELIEQVWYLGHRYSRCITVIIRLYIAHLC